VTVELYFLLAIVVTFATIPYLMLRGESARLYLLLDSISSGGLVVVWAARSQIRFELDVPLALATLLAVKLVVWTIAALHASGRGELLWSAGRAALLAGAVYVAIVPWTLRVPIDGDEPFYLLITESLIRDGDFDLRNQYAALGESEAGRTDLEPQPGDPVGPKGQQYSRHEPFLSLLMIPGYLLGGLTGAALTIALFGLLLARSVLLLLEEEGFSQKTMVLTFAFVLLGPPALFYATRIWPEIPGAFFLSEAVRAMRRGRHARFGAAIVGLVLLKLRFVAIGAGLVFVAILRSRSDRRLLPVAAMLALPFVIVWLITGDAMNVHTLNELAPASPADYLRGLSGLLVDGHGGLLFAAPMLFAGLAVFFIHGRLPASLRWIAVAAVPYIVLLLPRAEWHGGWAPPLRYLVVFTPLFALLVATVIDRLLHPALVALLALVTSVIVIHGVAWPWRLFHIADGQNLTGEWLSRLWGSDFGRIVPSVIRPNAAAVVAGAVLLAALAAMFAFRRKKYELGANGPLIATIVLAVLFFVGLQPGRVVHFEDAHLTRTGGELHPAHWTVARFLHTGGWAMTGGDSVSFLFRGGESVLYYRGMTTTILEINGREVRLPPTGEQFAPALVPLERRSGRHEIRVREGEVILDRIQRR
jgi:hypothetical protein